MHGVEAHPEFARGEQVANGAEVEQLLHQLGVVGDGIDHLDGHPAKGGLAQPVDLDIVCFEDGVRGYFPGMGEDRLGDLFRRRTAVGSVVFDAEVLVRTTGIMAGRQDDPPERLVLADDTGRRRRRQDTALAHQDPAETVGRRHPEDDLNGFVVVVAAIAAENQRLATIAFEGIENRLNEILQVVRLLENLHFLTKPGGSRLLTPERFCLNSLDSHLEIPLWPRITRECRPENYQEVSCFASREHILPQLKYNFKINGLAVQSGAPPSRVAKMWFSFA